MAESQGADRREIPKAPARWWARSSQRYRCVRCTSLDWSEARAMPHLAARGTFVEVDGVMQPAPAPRFSRTVPATPTPPAAVTPANTALALEQW